MDSNTSQPDVNAESKYSGIYIVMGIPGGGKTTMAAKQVTKICETIPRDDDEASPVAVCSMTKAAAREIASRDLPIPDWQVGTLHSMAYRQIGSPPVAEAEAKDFNDGHGDFAISAERDLDDTTGDTLLENPSAPGNETYQQYCLYRANLTPRDQWRPDVTYFAKLWEEWKQKQGLVDFCDMIDLAMTEGHGHAPGNPSVIVVDEVQDCNLQEWQLLRLWYEAAGAMIVVGDPYQMIYHWRGADSSIFFDQAIPDDRKKLLKQSHRVPRVVRDLSLQWLRENLSNFVEIEYQHRKEEGVLGVFNATYEGPDEVIAYVKNVLASSPDETVMIGASCGYMLKTTIKMLREEGIPFSNPWRRKRGDWNPLKPAGRRRKATHHKLMTFYDCLMGKRRATYADVHDILTLLRTEGTLVKGAKTFYKSMYMEAGSEHVEMTDIMNAFEPEAWDEVANSLENDPSGRTFCAWVGGRAAGQKAGVLRYAGNVVKNYGFQALVQEPRVFTGTIHSYKGAQADHVVLFPDLSFAGDRAYMSTMLGSEDDRDGVIRTFYVGMTRARKTLSFCTRKSLMAVDIPLDIL